MCQSTAGDYDALMKLLLLLAMLVLVGPARGDAPIDPRFEAQVATVIQEWSTLKPGSTRAEFLKIFPRPDGGIASGYDYPRYLYRNCEYIKVDITWNFVGKGRSPHDTIKTIAKPYLELMVID
jgi:hypothetical protein